MKSVAAKGAQLCLRHIQRKPAKWTRLKRISHEVQLFYPKEEPAVLKRPPDRSPCQATNPATRALRPITILRNICKCGPAIAKVLNIDLETPPVARREQIHERTLALTTPEFGTPLLPLEVTRQHRRDLLRGGHKERKRCALIGCSAKQPQGCLERRLEDVPADCNGEAPPSRAGAPQICWCTLQMNARCECGLSSARATKQRDGASHTRAAQSPLVQTPGA